jgi:peptidyl-dipeptidase Dcp
VLDRYHAMYKRAGAALDALREARLAKSTNASPPWATTSARTCWRTSRAIRSTLESEEDLAGLPDFAARSAAVGGGRARALTGKHVITTRGRAWSRSCNSPPARPAREGVPAWIARGDRGGATDNKAEIMPRLVALRAERASCSVSETFAHYRLDDAIAKTPAAVRDLLDRVWAPARAGALADRDAMQELVRQEGGNFAIAPWDWRYYAEKLRKVRCDIDEATVKPYFQLHHIIDAAFYTAYKLFGLTFERRKDVAAWHPDVMAWEVLGRDGRHLGLFLGDYFARTSKRSGAWMTTLRDQEKLTGPDVRPLVINVMNFQGRRGRADACSRSTTPARCSTNSATLCTGSSPDVTYPMVRAPACSPTGSSCRRSSTSTGWSGRKSSAASPFTFAPASRFRRTCCAASSPRGPSTRAIATVEYVASAWSISTSICGRRARQIAHPSTSTTFERDALARIGCRRRSSCGIAPPISSTYSRVAATPALLQLCGRRCSTPMLRRV